MLKPIILLSLVASALAKAVRPQISANDAPSRRESLLPLSESTELLSLHRKLIEIESITGHEQEVAQWLASYLRNNSFTVELQEVSPDRHNILAYGKKRDTTVLVTSHIDTVPPFWPYYHNETTDVIGGRGSVDAKGSVAPQIIAVQGLREKLFDDLSLLFVVGEETGGDGMRAFSAWEKRPESYEVIVFGEPTEGKLVCGHKGILGFSIKIRGKAAHSGYPWLGVSANDVLVEALVALHKMRAKLPSSEKYGDTTINLGRVEGGVAANVVAETAEANFAMRIAAGTPTEIRNLILSSLSEVTERAEKRGATLSVHWESEGYGPVDIDCDLGGFKTITVNYGTDLPNLKVEKGVRRYLYGPGSIQVAHSDHEALTRKELERAVLDYRRIIVEATRMDKYQKGGEQEVLEI